MENYNTNLILTDIRNSFDKGDKEHTTRNRT